MKRIPKRVTRHSEDVHVRLIRDIKLGKDTVTNRTREALGSASVILVQRGKEKKQTASHEQAIEKLVAKVEKHQRRLARAIAASDWPAVERENRWLSMYKKGIVRHEKGIENRAEPVVLKPLETTFGKQARVTAKHEAIKAAHMQAAGKRRTARKDIETTKTERSSNPNGLAINRTARLKRAHAMRLAAIKQLERNKK